MNRDDLYSIALKFRLAIEKARNDGVFESERFKVERMNRFPYDCCDDVSDLFAHYLFCKYGINSIRVDGRYYNDQLGCTCGHSWLVVNNLVVDLTGDQFDNEPIIPIKTQAVYVGGYDQFHNQFDVYYKFNSIGIESLNSACFGRMYGLYNSIIRYFE